MGAGSIGYGKQRVTIIVGRGYGAQEQRKSPIPSHCETSFILTGLRKQAGHLFCKYSIAYTDISDLLNLKYAQKMPGPVWSRALSFLEIGKDVNCSGICAISHTRKRSVAVQNPDMRKVLCNSALQHRFSQFSYQISRERASYKKTPEKSKNISNEIVLIFCIWYNANINNYSSSSFI